MERHTDVLKIRFKILEGDNLDVLYSNYWIGTINYYLDELEEAE
jgi:hypothetical protein